MKKFGGNKSVDEVKKKCKELGFKFKDDLYKQGHDHIRIDFSFADSKAPPVFKNKLITGHVLWSAFNGRFFGTLDKTAMTFDSNSSYLDDAEWYSQLLDLVYVEKKETADVSLSS
jgi:hypothetical protein